VLGSPLSLDLLRELSLMVDDSEVLPDVFSPDPDDNYLIARRAGPARSSCQVTVTCSGCLTRFPCTRPLNFYASSIESPHLIPGQALHFSRCPE
jgi:hypothetical protein